MFVKDKCLFLKKGIDGSELEKYGFHTLNEGCSYWLVLDDRFNQIGWYSNTRRFVFKYPGNVKARFILKKIRDRIPVEWLEIRPVWEWISIIGRWQDYPAKKLERIENKLRKLNKEELE